MVVQLYDYIQGFPKNESYALSDQMRRAAISIPSNIAEGLGRMAIKERIHFLEISFASLAEVSCQLDISQSLGYITEEELKIAEIKAEQLSKVMSGLKKYLSTKI